MQRIIKKKTNENKKHITVAQSLHHHCGLYSLIYGTPSLGVLSQALVPMCSSLGEMEVNGHVIDQ